MVAWDGNEATRSMVQDQCVEFLKRIHLRYQKDHTGGFVIPRGVLMCWFSPGHNGLKLFMLA